MRTNTGKHISVKNLRLYFTCPTCLCAPAVRIHCRVSLLMRTIGARFSLLRSPFPRVSGFSVICSPQVEQLLNRSQLSAIADDSAVNAGGRAMKSVSDQITCILPSTISNSDEENILGTPR
jgi:hypothetical protein